MRRFKLLILFCLAPATSTPTSGGRLTIANATTVGEALFVDPRFNLEVDYGQSPLPGVSVLMNAVHAMADLAFEDFQEPLVPIAYTLPDFPEVIIAPEATALGGAIQTRFIVWGLYKGIEAMTETRRAQTCVLTLKWEGVVVGYISIAKPKVELVKPENSNSGSPPKRLGSRALRQTEEMARNSTNVTYVLTDHNLLDVSFIPTGPALTGPEVLVTVLYALAYVAQFPSTTIVNGFELRPPSNPNMHLGVVGATMPFFQYRWVIEALDKIPRYMLYQHRFSGVTFKMLLGGVEVGQGQMFKER